MSGTPKITLEGGRVIYVGPGLDLAPHRNAAATIAVGLDCAFELSLAGPELQRLSAALIPPGTWHHLRARGRMAFVYLDALSDEAAALPSEFDVEALISAITREEVDLGSVMRALGVMPRASGRLDDTLRILHADPDGFRDIEAAATHAGLSPSRFRHLFRDEIGMTFRRYRRWRRFARVAAHLEEGATLTEAALTAGFASSAHFSATFRETFGLAPSELLRRKARFRVRDVRA